VLGRGEGVVSLHTHVFGEKERNERQILYTEESRTNERP
jgi:hypothetical protein